MDKSSVLVILVHSVERLLLTNVLYVTCRLRTLTTVRLWPSLLFACKANVRTTRGTVLPTLPTGSRQSIKTRSHCTCKWHRLNSLSPSGLIVSTLHSVFGESTISDFIMSLLADWWLSFGGYTILLTRSTQLCILWGSLNWVPALISWGKGSQRR